MAPEPPIDDEGDVDLGWSAGGHFWDRRSVIGLVVFVSVLVGALAVRAWTVDPVVDVPGEIVIPTLPDAPGRLPPLVPATPREIPTSTNAVNPRPLAQRVDADLYFVRRERPELVHMVALDAPARRERIELASELDATHDDPMTAFGGGLVYTDGDRVHIIGGTGRRLFSTDARDYVVDRSGTVWILREPQRPEGAVIVVEEGDTPDPRSIPSNGFDGRAVGSATSGRLVVQHGQHVAIWDPVEERTRATGMSGKVLAAGSGVIVTCPSTCEELSVTSIETGQGRVIDFVPASVRALGASISPRGRYVAVSTVRLDTPDREHRLFVLNLASGESWLVPVGTLPPEGSTRPAWSDDPAWVFQATRFGDGSFGVVAYKPGDPEGFEVPDLPGDAFEPLLDITVR